MEKPNPYEAPAETVAPLTADTTICINEFAINEYGFFCSVFTRDQVAKSLREELARYCAELGFNVVNEGACCHVTGELVTLDQGNRILRSLVPGILGAVKVEGNCQITKNGQAIKEINFRQRKALGFQGGNTRSLLELSLRQIALQIGSEVGVTTGHIDTGQSVKASQYLWLMTASAAFIGIALSVAAYAWAVHQPARHDGLEEANKPWWACVVFLFLFVTLFLFGLAAAPSSVLTSRTLLSLRSASGVKSIGAQRIVIALLAAAPIGLLVLAYFSI